MENRNEARWIQQEKGLIDYDCYLDCETEFLTKSGWRPYDRISDKEEIGTLNPVTKRLEWQEPNSRYESSYSGELYSYENSYTRFTVTPNHKLFLSNAHRGPSNNYSSKYVEASSDWKLETVKDYFSSKRSHKHFFVVPDGNDFEGDVNWTDDKIKLLGLYLSEGSILYNKKGIPKYISISQLDGGRSCKIIESIIDIEWAVSKHLRKGRLENSYIFKDEAFASYLATNCGVSSHDKRIPFEHLEFFSVHQYNILIEAMVSGDGHVHAKGHTIYYTASKRLADDIQLLSCCQGKVVQIYGPYHYGNREFDGKEFEVLPMYQVFFSKTRQNDNIQCLNKSMLDKRKEVHLNSYSGWEVRKVKEQRIVCFDVDNGVLLTRNKKKIAVQGNSKNMSHCMRLMLSSKSILTEGYPIVRFEGEQLDLLKRIKRGELEYAEIMEMVNGLQEELEVLVEKTHIPDVVDFEKLDKLYRHLNQIAEKELVI
jgi:hypothetical protein